MNKTMNLTLRDDLTEEQFEQIRASGRINPLATFEDYLELRREREEARREAERLGWTGEAPPELSAEEEEMLLAAWRTVAAEKDAAKKQSIASSGAA